MSHFLILTSAEQTKLINTIKERGHTFESYDPNDCYLFVSESENGYDRLYNGSAELETPVRLKAKSFDAVISRIGNSLNHGASILRHVNENLGIYSAQDAEGLLTASDKLKTTQKLSYHGLRVPKTIYAKNSVHVKFLVDKVGGFPAVGKLLKGSQGVGVNILETPLATKTALESFEKCEIEVKIQQFIEAKGKDIRAIVVGDSVAIAMERTAQKGEFRANISKNGSGRKIELSDADKEICIKAAKAVGLSFAGVDIMKDADGKTYVIEVNGNPGSKIIELTGHNYFVDLIKFIEGKIGHSEKKADSDSKATASTGIVDTIKNAVFGSKDSEAVAELKALKARHPRLLKDFDI